MTLDLRWLAAPDSEVAAAMAAVRRDSRPKWVPTRRQVLVHVNYSLMLWYLGIAFVTIGISVDVQHDGSADAADIGALVAAVAVLAVWLVGTFWLHRWAARPPSPKVQMGGWRQDLTALANGYEPQPREAAGFTSLITSGAGRPRAYPRFASSGIEFGNLIDPGSRSADWHYLAVTLPAPLPHLVLEATANGSDLPAGVDRSQRLTFAGEFDRAFRVYAPAEYEADALYFLTPDVMAALVDDAAGFNVEIVDDTLVFFTSEPADFGSAATWERVAAILGNAAARIVDSATRYRDERVPGQEVPLVMQEIRHRMDHPSVPWIAPEPRIGVDGHRLDITDRRHGVWSVLGAVGWFVLRTALYAVPGIFAFAGFMSIVDGR
ncbi:hypothetical protein HD599_000365 [Conyzicola lurida]|uniref:DUF3137 domain-containing protein n=1 Tax=Conyzicola lurida TaxID=1172621 RepID=A0A841AJ84_9MICO|nr:hypothetical protein [Conyzicola lurida]MBB5842042.1 hypothetical protein [Conyzicola lurida]